MNETVPVGGNKFEAACAIRNLKKIMGQISSSNSHQGGGHQQQRPHMKNGKVYHRYSSPPIAMRPFANEDDDLLLNKGVIRDSKRILGKVSSASTAATHKQRHFDAGGVVLAEASDAQINVIGRKLSTSSGMRPVTVTDMNNWNRNLDKQEMNSQLIIMNAANGGQSADTPVKGGAAAAVATPPSSKQQKPSRDVFAVEGYHKTDHCYYKRPDGGYLKLPPDSFHKMSEGCYIKRSDGTFVRIDSAAAMANSQTSNKSAVVQQQQQNDASVVSGSAGQRPKSNVLRFLKRSKSHTPSTMKELQREKERGEKVQNRGALAERSAGQQQVSGAQNRRVMVTMIDGGLPVVATSKAERVQKPSKSHLQVKSQSGKGKDSRNKVNKRRSDAGGSAIRCVIICGRHLEGAIRRDSVIRYSVPSRDYGAPLRAYFFASGAAGGEEETEWACDKH